jgi:hypothetical protein
MGPTSAKLKSAIEWVNERRRTDAELSMALLVQDASRRFDLDLNEQYQLRHLFHA